jgi:hypothetical protein
LIYSSKILRIVKELLKRECRASFVSHERKEDVKKWSGVMKRRTADWRGWFAAKPNGVPAAKMAARVAWSKAGRRELLLAY